MSIIADDNTNKKVDINAKNPVIKPEAVEYDRNFENSIRPKSFDSYIGQSALKEALKITIEAAKKEKNLLIIYCFTDRRDLERLHLPVLLQNKWV